MTKEEATKVIKTMMSADGQCFVCANSLLWYFTQEFPEWKDLANELYRKEWDEEITSPY
jgi:hypothetical protein